MTTANASKFDGAKAAATAKITRWCAVQMKAQEKKNAARAAGDARLAAVYFDAEIKASCRRSRHEDALVRIDRFEREARELAAWNARRRG